MHNSSIVQNFVMTKVNSWLNMATFIDIDICVDISLNDLSAFDGVIIDSFSIIIRLIKRLEP